MTARSNESPKEILSGQQLFEQINLTTEQNLAKKLGNLERLEKWQKVKSFNAPRHEWLGAWKRFAGKHGLKSMFGIRKGVPVARQTAILG